MTDHAAGKIVETFTQKAARSRQRRLGKELARRYSAVTTEPLPREFTSLLADIDVRLTDLLKKP